MLVAAAVLLGLLLAVLIAGCGEDSEIEGTPTPGIRVSTPTPTATPAPGLTPVPTEPTPTATPQADGTTSTATATPGQSGGPAMDVPDHLLDAARRDLSGRTGVAPSQISLAAAEEVVWPDTSLGVPEPGRVYAQVLTPGWRLILEAGGNRYEYHTDLQRVVFAGQVR